MAEWMMEEFLFAKPFKQLIETVSDMLAEKTLDGVYCPGAVPGNNDAETPDETDRDNSCLELNDPVIFQFHDLSLKVCFYNRSHASAGFKTKTGESYKEPEWKNLSDRFSCIIGQSLKNIFLTTFSEEFRDRLINEEEKRPNGGDYFESLYLVFENGYAIEIRGANEHMQISVRVSGAFREFPTDLRLMTGPDSYGGIRRTIIPALNEVEVREAMINIDAEDFSYLDLFLAGEGCELDEYADAKIPIETWKNALIQWKDFCSLSSFDEVLEKMAGVNYTDWTVEKPGIMDFLARRGVELWKGKDSSEEMLNDLLVWTEMYEEKCNFIVHEGY